MTEPHLSLVIPAYNEAERIGPSLEKIRSYLGARPYSAELIVVDDGSTDGMPQLLERMQSGRPELRILRHTPNRGKGYSVRCGMLEARGEFVLFSDADLSTPVEELDKLLRIMEESGADAVAGSRAMERKLVGIHQPWYREYAGRFFNQLVRLFSGLELKDTQCGFKLYRRATTRGAFLAQRTEGFGFDVEVLFLIRHAGGRIVEAPVKWNNDPATKVRLIRDSAAMFADLLLIRLRAWTGRYGRAASAA